VCTLHEPSSVSPHASARQRKNMHDHTSQVQKMPLHSTKLYLADVPWHRGKPESAHLASCATPSPLWTQHYVQVCAAAGWSPGIVFVTISVQARRRTPSVMQPHAPQIKSSRIKSNQIACTVRHLTSPHREEDAAAHKISERGISAHLNAPHGISAHLNAPRGISAHLNAPRGISAHLTSRIMVPQCVSSFLAYWLT